MSSSDNALVTNQLPVSIDFPREEDQFYPMLTDLYKRIAYSTNSKENALYYLQETATFKQYFTVDNPQKTRNVYRFTYDLVDLNGGNIAGGATVAFPHGITGISDTAIIYCGCVSTDPLYFSVMYPNVYLDSVNINFTNPLGTALTKANAVCEYLKN